MTLHLTQFDVDAISVCLLAGAWAFLGYAHLCSQAKARRAAADAQITAAIDKRRFGWKG